MSSPTISGAFAGQTTTDQDAIAPFAGVTISDDQGQSETVTVTLSDAADGSLGSGAGTYDAHTGIYTVTGSAAVVSADLEGLIFTPTTGTPGNSVTTSFAISTTDTASATATDDTTSVTVTSGPSISGTQADQAISDQATANPFAGVSITDDPGQIETITVTLSSPAGDTLTDLGGGSYDSGAGVYTDSGSTASVTADLNRLVFTPAQGTPGQSVTTTFSISDTDTASVTATDGTTSVIATGGPSISGSLPDQPINDQSTVNPFANVTIADDSGQTETVTVTLSAAGNGMLSNLDGGTYDVGGGTYSIAGSASAVTAALEGLVFTPAQGTPGQSVTTSFTISDTDSASVTVTDSTTSVTVSSGPTITGTQGGQTTTDQSAIEPFAGVVIADDAGQVETVTVTLSAAGDGVLSNHGNGSYDTGTGIYTDTGSAAAVTADLDGLVFTPALGTPGQSVTTTFTISDTDTASVTVTDSTTMVTASAGPGISGTAGGQTATDQTTVIPFGGVTIADDPGQTENITITLSAAANGTLSNLGAGSYDDANGVYTDSGTSAAVTADLDQLVFTPTQGTPGESTTTTFTISDTDSASVTVSDSTTSVTVTSGPSISGTVADQPTTDQASLDPFANVILADQAGQTETLTVTLSSISNGTLTNLGGGSYNTMSGVYTDTGSAAAVTADLNQLTFVPAQGTPGQSATTTFVISDTDTASASVSDGTTSVIVNSGPAISGTLAGQPTTNQASVNPFAGVAITDQAGQIETVTVTLSNAANGSLGNPGNGSYDVVNGIYTDTGSATAVTADLQGLVFTPAAGTPGEDVTTVFTISDTDSASVTTTDSTTTVIDTTGPAILGSVAGQAISDLATVSPFANLTIADDSSQTETVAVTLSSATNGSLGNLGNGSYDAVNGIYTDTGSATAVTADLQGLVFTPTTGTPGTSVTTTFTISDTDTADITATDSTTTVIADSGPAISGAAVGQTVADASPISPFAALAIADDMTQTETLSVSFTAANGTLGNVGNGSYDAITGVYTDAGTAAAVTDDLRGLVFTPVAGTPGQPAVVTTFTIIDTDTAGLVAIDGTTSVAAQSGPTISGSEPGQTIAGSIVATPFAGVTITDDISQTETVTITPSAAGNGVLSSPDGSYNAGTGVYTITGSATTVTAALDGLVFTPTAGTPGHPATTTTFTIQDTDSVRLTALDSTTTVIVQPGPAISDTIAGQTIADTATATPFASLSIADDNSQTETVTVTLSATGNGALSNLDGGSYNAATGVYTVTGGGATVTAALDGLVFTPTAGTPGQPAVVTTFTISDTDTAGLIATDSTTSVVAQSGPVISGSGAGQTIADTATATPFASVVVADDVSQTETLTVTLSNHAHGSLSNLGGGSYNSGSGVYNIIGSAATVTAALDGLVFNPAHGTPGAPTVTTTFTIHDTDTVGLTTTGSTASVAVLQGPGISGAVAGQSIADTATVSPFAQLTLADVVSQTETVTVTLSAAGNGVLSNLAGGNYNAGVYSISGSASTVTVALDNLVFTPAQGTPGQPATTTTFTVHAIDTAGLTATNSTTSVEAQAGLAISGAAAGQSIAATATDAPFANLTLADDASQSEAVTVTLSAAGNGVLSNLAGGSYNAGTGIYTVSGSAIGVTAALDGLVFTPSASILPGETIATSFTIAATDTVGATDTDSTTSVNAIAAPLVSNTQAGTSFVSIYNPAAGASETTSEYSGLNGTGSLVSETVNRTDASSLLYSFNPTSTVSETASVFNGPNVTGSRTTEVVDNTNGSSLDYAYNPTSTVTLTAETWSGTDPSSGAPTGNLTSDVVDNTDGTSLLYTYNPTSTVTQTTAIYGSTDTSDGAPAGNAISDVVDNSNGTSIFYQYNPSSGITQTATYYSGTNTADGAPSGNIMSVTFDFTDGESAITTYNSDDSTSTQNYSGLDGTGSPIETLGDAVALSSPPTGSVSLPAPADSGSGVTTITGSNQLIDPGPGNQTIQFAAGATADTVLLHTGASDQILGFNPTAGDMLDLSSLLSDAHVSLGSDLSQLSSYVSVAPLNGSAQILFDPTGHGGGSQVALLLNDGGLVQQLQTLKSFVA